MIHPFFSLAGIIDGGQDAIADAAAALKQASQPGPPRSDEHRLRAMPVGRIIQYCSCSLHSDEFVRIERPGAVQLEFRTGEDEPVETAVIAIESPIS